MKTSHKKNRPFDFKLIDLVERQPLLYQRQMGLKTYEAMKAKNVIWRDIAREMQAPIDFCIMRWANLRCQFQKELRHCRELCPKEGTIRGSTWPYLDRLHFLEGTLQSNKPRRIRPTAKIKKQTLKKNDSEQNTLNAGCPFSTDIKNNEEEIVDEGWDYIEEDTIAVDQTSEVEIGYLKSDNHTEDTTKEEDIDCGLNDILESIDSVNRPRVERRIMAFLCKCQLRTLSGENIDDLVI